MDADAFEALYDKYSRLVYGVAFRVLADAAAAEDVTQGVFLKIWRSPDAFRGGNLEGWLVRVARNAAIDVVRARTARPEVEFPASLPGEETLEETAFAKLENERVRRAVAELAEGERALIELGFFGGVTHQELARRTGIPLGTVKTRMRTALRKLRAMLEGAVTP